jgi:nucleoside-diphosphate-sugar epimerase
MDESREAFAWFTEDLERADSEIYALPEGTYAAPDTVLLTGATGFIGSHVLSRLVTDGFRVVCLVRSGSRDDARERLGKAARRWRAPEPAANKVDVVLGDCSKPRLGLSPSAYDEMASRIDAVAHFAMYGEYITPYARFRRTWVQCLRELVTLCLTRRPKALHVAGSFNTHFFRDEGNLGRLETNAWHSGYSAYKLVAERIITAAARQGAPFAWYDLPLALGAEDEPMEREDYGAFQILDLFLQVGAILDFALQAVTPNEIASVLSWNLQLGPAQHALLRPMADGAFTGKDLQEFLVDQGLGRLPIFDSADPQGPALTRRQRFLVPDDFTTLQRKVQCQKPLHPAGYATACPDDAGRVIRANAATWSPLRHAIARKRESVINAAGGEPR